MQSNNSQPRTGAVVAVGALMMDLLCQVDELPQAGQGVVVTSSEMTLGGCAFNSAEVLRQLGISCELLAPTGRGMFAHMAKEQLDARGLALWSPGEGDEGGEGNLAVGEGAVDTSQAATHAEPVYDCGACICFVTPDGQRTMVTLPGVERHFQPHWFDGAPTKEVALAFCSGYEVDGAGGNAILDYLASIRHDSPEAVIIYAAGPRIASVSDDKLQKILELRAVWHINDQEALEFTGEETLETAGQQIAQLTGSTVIVTAGAAGAYVFEPRADEEGAPDGADAFGAPNGAATSGAPAGAPSTHVPTTPVEVVDTVGAGDAHLGATIAAYMQGMNWVDATAFANKISAVICQNVGATVDEAQLAIFRQMLYANQQ